jgi:hypothetical protein
MARAWVDLMKRLDYPRYVAQGGDWEAIITDLMAAQAPPGLLGMHTNMPGVVPPDVSTALARNVLGLAARRHPACSPRKAERVHPGRRERLPARALQGAAQK